jgi:hypothetical protein
LTFGRTVLPVFMLESPATYRIVDRHINTVVKTADKFWSIRICKWPKFRFLGCRGGDILLRQCTPIKFVQDDTCINPYVRMAIMAKEHVFYDPFYIRYYYSMPYFIIRARVVKAIKNKHEGGIR